MVTRADSPSADANQVSTCNNENALIKHRVAHIIGNVTREWCPQGAHTRKNRAAHISHGVLLASIYHAAWIFRDISQRGPTTTVADFHAVYACVPTYIRARIAQRYSAADTVASRLRGTVAKCRAAAVIEAAIGNYPLINYSRRRSCAIFDERETGEKTDLKEREKERK